MMRRGIRIISPYLGRIGTLCRDTNDIFNITAGEIQIQEQDLFRRDHATRGT